MYSINKMLPVIVFSAIVVSNIFYLYKFNSKNKINKDPISDVDNYIKKNEKYLDRIVELKKSTETIIVNDINPNNYLMEYTPLGCIIMCYDNLNKEFLYSSNKKIPYNVLESVCQKFVVIFGLETLYTLMECKISSVEKKKLPKQYANFKPTSQLKEKITKEMNRFRYVGQLKDFKFIQDQNLDKKETICYSDFILSKNKKN